MNKKDIEEIYKICEEEIEQAISKEEQESIPFYQGYHMGRKNTAQTIISKISKMYQDELLNKYRQNE